MVRFNHVWNGGGWVCVWCFPSRLREAGSRYYGAWIDGAQDFWVFGSGSSPGAARLADLSVLAEELRILFPEIGLPKVRVIFLGLLSWRNKH